MISSTISSFRGTNIARRGMSQLGFKFEMPPVVEGQKFPSLKVHVRDVKESGSRQSRYLRADRIIPALAYGNTEDWKAYRLLCKLPRKELNRYLLQRGSAFENTLYELQVVKTVEEKLNEKETRTTETILDKFVVLPRETQFQPVTMFPMSVTFLRYYPGTLVRIPVEYINEDECVEIKRGGALLVTVNRFVEVVCDHYDIPAKIFVDVKSMGKGDVVRASAIPLPPGIKLASKTAAGKILAVAQPFK